MTHILVFLGIRCQDGVCRTIKVSCFELFWSVKYGGLVFQGDLPGVPTFWKGNRPIYLARGQEVSLFYTYLGSDVLLLLGFLVLAD